MSFVGWKPIKLTTEVSAMAVTPVCERIHGSFESLGTGT